ncbi:MAG: TIGR00153 family protein [Gammaproteobacteria bacterium]|nr:TIGR00153 family protein [Gammaproteobacteria bacterium]
MAVQSPFSRLFGKSPFDPVQEHMGVAHECVAELVLFVGAVIKNDWEAAEKSAETVYRLESKADDMKKDIRLHLPKSLFLPIPRSDLLEMLRLQDKIPNRAKDVTGLMLGRRMVIPPQIAARLMAYAQCTEEAVIQAVKTLAELDDLIETGFSGRAIHLVETLVEELDRREHETDLMQIDVRSALFEIEDDLKPVAVMFLYKIIEWIGEIADHSQIVGHRMLYLIAK